MTAAENESSTVLFGDFGLSKIILTGDGGASAIRWACNHAAIVGLNISAAALVQVPHHGSRSNVSPSALNMLVGPRLPSGAPEVKKAIVSAPKDDDKHPRKMVMNAFKRRGAGVRRTQGSRYRFHSGSMPTRPGEVPAQAFEFFDRVEAYD